MTRRHRVGAKTTRSLRQRCKLQIAVAVRAGKGRPSGGVLADEVRDDLVVELLLEVHDVVRNADRGRDTPGVVQVVNRAAAAERTLPPGLIVELHGQTDDLVALLGEQGGRHGRVDTAGHRYDDTHLKQPRKCDNTKLAKLFFVLSWLTCLSREAS